MTDIALGLVDGVIDILTSDSGELVKDNGLETAVLISLFTDQRVSKGQVPSGQISQRGWWADEFLGDGDAIGSKLWTVTDRGKANQATAVVIQTRAKQALEWMIEDGVAESVDVTAQRVGTFRIDFTVKIKRPGADEDDIFSLQWDGQELKR